MQDGAEQIGESLDSVERSVLPHLPHLLDGLIDSAALARAGADADMHATELRYAAFRLDALTALLDAVAPAAQDVGAARRISA
ncbi:hypothetical protein [Sphingosinicella sp. CPCC 101087]|uniref:hypothetical protein n=1 Tax=Sphingosinicella sp. CPCC 101087 TaxID=2497754 RepID=UPI00101E00CA|nr:hypothetical protein [Sphingosinicella sp. CPCC 101087]